MKQNGMAIEILIFWYTEASADSRNVWENILGKDRNPNRRTIDLIVWIIGRFLWVEMDSSYNILNN